MQRDCHRAGIVLEILWAVLGAASIAIPQGSPPAPPPVEPQFSQGPVTAVAGPGFVYLSAGPMWEEKTVIGSPYSAEAVSENRQILADGNVIDHKESSMIYRDSAGRVRRETNGIGMLGTGGSVQSFAQTSGNGAPGAGMVTVPDNAGGPEVAVRTGPVMGGESVSTQAGPGGKTLSVIGAETVNAMGGKRVTIYDPVSQITFLLDPARKIAYKMIRPPEEMTHFRAFVQRNGSRRESNITSQSLGTRTFDGVTAYGTRTTMVIPAGAIGNEKPITVVSNRWYSPKLQTNVMTRRDDPRFGVITYQLKTIKLGEPSEALFKVPVGYTIKSFPPEPARPGGGGTPPK
ncbi:MAG: hypothetical protein ACRD3O_00195 [Terriglobia bacterium]